MFYVIPKDGSLAENVGKFFDFEYAKMFACGLKEKHGTNFDITRVEQVWTTQTLDEAHRLSPDIPHMGRD